VTFFGVFQVHNHVANTGGGLGLHSCKRFEILGSIHSVLQCFNKLAPHFNFLFAALVVEHVGKDLRHEVLARNDLLFTHFRNPQHSLKSHRLVFWVFVFVHAQVTHLCSEGLTHGVHVQQLFPSFRNQSHLGGSILRDDTVENGFHDHVAIAFVITYVFDNSTEKLSAEGVKVVFVDFRQQGVNLFAEWGLEPLSFEFALGHTKFVLSVGKDTALSKATLLTVDPIIAKFCFVQFLLPFFGRGSFCRSVRRATFEGLGVVQGDVPLVGLWGNGTSWLH